MTMAIAIMEILAKVYDNFLLKKNTTPAVRMVMVTRTKIDDESGIALS